MPRLIVLIIFIALLIGALFVLSSLPKQQPTRTIEVDVPAPGGNAN